MAAGSRSRRKTNAGIFGISPRADPSTTAPSRPAATGCSAASSTRLAFVSADGVLRVLDLTHTPAVQRAMPFEAVQSIALSPDGRWLIAARDGGQVQQHDLEDAGARARFVAGWPDRHRCRACDLFQRRPRTAASMHKARSFAGTWRARASRPVFAGHGVSLRDAAFSPDGGLLASVDATGSLIVWDASSQRRLSEPMIGPGDVEDAHYRVRFSPDGLWLDTESGGCRCTRRPGSPTCAHAC